MIKILAEFEDRNGTECISISKKEFNAAIEELESLPCDCDNKIPLSHEKVLRHSAVLKVFEVRTK